MTKMCNDCRLVLPLRMFHNRSEAKDGKQSKCKKCTNEWYRKYRQLERENGKKIKHNGELRMKGITQQDWCGTYAVLQKLGYDIHSDIHEQFSKKYGLPIKERPKLNLVRFSPEDCDF